MCSCFLGLALIHHILLAHPDLGLLHQGLTLSAIMPVCVWHFLRVLSHLTAGIVLKPPLRCQMRSVFSFPSVSLLPITCTLSSLISSRSFHPHVLLPLIIMQFLEEVKELRSKYRALNRIIVLDDSILPPSKPSSLR